MFVRPLAHSLELFRLGPFKRVTFYVSFLYEANKQGITCKFFPHDFKQLVIVYESVYFMSELFFLRHSGNFNFHPIVYSTNAPMSFCSVAPRY